MEKTQRWEYKFVPLTWEVWKERLTAKREGREPRGDSISHILNKLGEEGWELVSIRWGEEIEAVLKRSKA